MTAPEQVVTTARGEVGYIEQQTNRNKYAAELDSLRDAGINIYNGRKDGYDWCDIFVDWCHIHTFGPETGVKLLNQPLDGCGAGCTWSMSYYKQAGRFFKTPEVGDQIFFSRDGGKTSYHTGIVVQVAGSIIRTVEGNSGNNCDRVAEHTYNTSLSLIAGYGRPDWSVVPPDVPKPSTWAAESWSAAVAAGILDGSEPAGQVTREMFAVVLDRLGLIPRG